MGACFCLLANKFRVVFICFYRKIYGPHICGEALDIDGAHHHLLTGSWRKDHNLQIWDFRTGKHIKDIFQESHNSSLVSFYILLVNV